MKIKNVSVTGLRGVRGNLNLPLEGKSVLIYGDNGTGKSTLSDVIEWFFYDRVDHLADEEIGRKGYEAIRNIFLKDDEPGSLKMTFSDNSYSAEKSIEIRRNAIKSFTSNSSEEFTNYIESSQQENLILRYKDLVKFVLSSKSEKLKALSDIIGYSNVTKVKSTLSSVLYRLTRDIKAKNLDDQMNYQQGQVMVQFSQNITSDKQFIEIVKELVQPFSLEGSVKDYKDMGELLKILKQPDDSAETNQETFLIKIQECLLSISCGLDKLADHYESYSGKFLSIVSDIEILEKLAIEKLLIAGQNLLLEGAYSENNCPLCLEDLDRQELLSQVKERIIELEEIKISREELGNVKGTLQREISGILQSIRSLSGDKQIANDRNRVLKKNLEILESKVVAYEGQLTVRVLAESVLEDGSKLQINKDYITTIDEDCRLQLEEIKAARVENSQSDVYSKINIASHAYNQIKELRRQKKAYEIQRVTMEAVCDKFIKTQKESLESFLESFSDSVNEIYQFLNPNEKVENIHLVPIEKGGNLVGITIQFDFIDNKKITPPHKYLSESHLNCLGIAFFLSSVKAFNHVNKFILLDDVISSFDASHRKRFADLMVEKFGDYQIILLTHEKTWFHMVRNLVRGKNWNISTFKHSEARGTYIDEPPTTLPENIRRKISEDDENGLGNDIRKYLEYLLKKISHNLEVKLQFRFNETNEDRMAFELLTELKGTLNKRKCTELINEPLLDRLLGSLFIGNKNSHDSSLEPTLSDTKAFWNDVTDFESLFYCSDCKSFLSSSNYDKVNKKIRCAKGELNYDWKK